MTYHNRLRRITSRARLVYRLRHAVEGGMIVATVAAAASFLVMLLAGLGLVATTIWTPLAIGAGVGVGLGALIGVLRPLRDDQVIRWVDRDQGLGNALTTTRSFLLGGAEPKGELAVAHVKQSLRRAERLVMARALTADLGARARILGILCVCVISVALI